MDDARREPSRQEREIGGADRGVEISVPQERGIEAAAGRERGIEAAPGRERGIEAAVPRERGIDGGVQVEEGARAERCIEVPNSTGETAHTGLV